MASSEPALPLAAGPAIARTIALAAELALLTARTAGRADLAQRARALAAEAKPLAATDAAAYHEFLRTKSEEARARTIELPLRMADLAADATELAEEVSGACSPPVNGDAQAGVLLAEAAAEAAALLVKINTGTDLARPSADRAHAARFRALL